MVCRICKKPGYYENEDHLLICESLKSENKNQNVKFDYVFQDFKKQKIAIHTFKSVLRKRDVILKYQEKL